MQAQSACLACPEGFYCPTSAMDTPTICPVGKYCVASSTTSANCPSGTYMLNTGSTSSSQCYPCKLGWACTSTNLSAPDQQCTAGYWCRSSAISITTALLADFYGPCTPGAYCPLGTSYPVLCSLGTFSAASSTCGQCREILLTDSL